ncbi:acyl-CoA dehydrogenase family protein [Enterococcus eurekensis]|uniref:Acyl-CoA dehydrogenase family protein n=1 Tax=Enterococcus eurekensis TaxID=1159753 RepID=A0ABV9M5Y3_9ENTE
MIKNQEKLTAIVENYANTTIREVATQYDASEQFPQAEWDYLVNLGILYMVVEPPESLIPSYKAFIRLIRIISKQFPALGSILLTQASYAIWPLFQFGTAAQKARYLEPLLKGEIFGSFAANEIDSGSNLQQMETIALETAEGWIITGEKAFISNAPISTLFSVVSKTRSLKGEEGFGVFLIDRDTEGLTVGPLENKMGIKSLPVAGVSLKSVFVPHTALLGDVMQGLKQVQSVLNRNRLAISAQAIGIAQGALDRGLEYVSFERNIGKRLIDLKTNQYRLADVQTKILATRAFLLQTLDEAPDDTQRVAMIKLAASDLAIDVTETIINVTGGYGYMRNNEIERFVRDAKITAIYGGSSDTQRYIIAEPWRLKS